MPAWLPGSWIRREAEKARALRNKMIEVPYQYVQERMVSWLAENERIFTGSRCYRNPRSKLMLQWYQTTSLG